MTSFTFYFKMLRVHIITGLELQTFIKKVIGLGSIPKSLLVLSFGIQMNLVVELKAIVCCQIPLHTKHLIFHAQMVIIQSARWQCDLIKNILLKELCEIKINSSINQSSNNDIVEHSFILNFDFDSFFGGGLFAFPDNISQGFVSNCRFNFGDAILMECRANVDIKKRDKILDHCISSMKNTSNFHVPSRAICHQTSSCTIKNHQVQSSASSVIKHLELSILKHLGYSLFVLLENRLKNCINDDFPFKKKYNYYNLVV